MGRSWREGGLEGVVLCRVTLHLRLVFKMSQSLAVLCPLSSFSLSYSTVSQKLIGLVLSVPRALPSCALPTLSLSLSLSHTHTHTLSLLSHYSLARSLPNYPSGYRWISSHLSIVCFGWLTLSLSSLSLSLSLFLSPIDLVSLDESCSAHRTLVRALLDT